MTAFADQVMEFFDQVFARLTRLEDRMPPYQPFVHRHSPESIDVWITLPEANHSHRISPEDARKLLRDLEEVV